MYFKKPVQFYLDVGALIRGLFDPQVGYGLLSIKPSQIVLVQNLFNLGF